MSSRSEFLEKFSANNFVLSDAQDNISGPLNRGNIADLPLLRTLLAIFQEVPRASFLGSGGLLVAASRALLQQLLAYLNFTLESEDLFFWYTKKLFTRPMAAAQAAENHGCE